MGHGIAALLVALSLGGCKKSNGAPSDTTAASGEGSGAEAGSGAPEGGGEAAPEEGTKPEAGDAPAGGGAMSVAEFCKTFGEKAEKEGGKAADFWKRNLGKDCEKDLGDEKKKKGDDKWNAFVSCANGKATAADAFDECEL